VLTTSDFGKSSAPIFSVALRWESAVRAVDTPKVDR
jgi:hypothetical protein